MVVPYNYLYSMPKEPGHGLLYNPNKMKLFSKTTLLCLLGPDSLQQLLPTLDNVF